MSETRNDANGGPAFPSGDFQNMEPMDGMSLRDYFAAKALAVSWEMEAEAGKHWLNTGSYRALAARSYAMADAMLKQRDAK